MKRLRIILILMFVFSSIVALPFLADRRSAALHVSVVRVPSSSGFVIGCTITNRQIDRIYGMEDTEGIRAKWKLVNGSIAVDKRFVPDRDEIIFFGPGEGTSLTFVSPSNTLGCTILIEASAISRLGFYLRNNGILGYPLGDFVDRAFKVNKYKESWEFGVSPSGVSAQ